MNDTELTSLLRTQLQPSEVQQVRIRERLFARIAAEGAIEEDARAADMDETFWTHFGRLMLWSGRTVGGTTQTVTATMYRFAMV
ncbi:MAG: hypothetical protein OHK0029_43320 [Armatimonadaceae bacterium]